MNNNCFRVLCIWLMIMVTHTSCNAGALVLATGGRSEYSIVVPEAATKNELKAAALLQQFLKAAGKADLAIVKESANKNKKALYIGACKNVISSNLLLAIQDDGYIIKQQGENLVLAGARGHGTEYAVYAFAEQFLHARKYDSSPAVIPTQASILLPADIHVIANPAFRYRQSYYPMSNDAAYLDWHALHRFEDLWGLWGHSFFKLVPPATYFQAHPEYFSLVNGKRTAIQLCLSNAQVLQITIKRLGALMKENPDAEYWSVSPNDDGGYCTCTLCKHADEEEGGPQGSVIRFVNKVAAAFPDKNIITLAYGYTAKAPRQTKPAANVYVFLSSIDAFREAPLADIASAAAFRKDLAGWAAITEHIFVWDYATEFTNYLAPFPRLQTLPADFIFFRKNKVQGIFEQGSGDTYSDMAELNSYVQAKLLWHPEADLQAIVTDFCKGYYGNAATYVQEYLKARQNAMVQSGRHLDIYGSPVTDSRGFLSPAMIDTYDQLLEKASQSVTGTVLQDRIGRIRLSLDYTVLQQSRHFGKEQYGFLIDEGGTEYKVKANWAARVSRFVSACKQAGVTELSERGFSPDQYGQEWKKIIEKKWPANVAAGAEVSLQYPFVEDYPAKGNRTLTDGMTGFPDFSYNWLCFYGTDMVATLNMGKRKAAKSISINFLDDPRHWIFPPEKVIVETSEDGKVFRQIAIQSLSTPEEHNDARIQQTRFNLDPGTTLRFMRITAINAKQLPAWRNYGNKKPMIACDEIMLLP